MSIPISTVKAWRESIDATHLVVFAVGRDGVRHVATHGETEQNALDAADFGNRLKATLAWPESLCHSTPLARRCSNCTYYKPDYGIHCFNGWSQDGSTGLCLHMACNRYFTRAEYKCAEFEPKV